jgi:hypothetical protein
MSPIKDAIHPRPKGRGILAWFGKKRDKSLLNDPMASLFALHQYLRERLLTGL